MSVPPASSQEDFSEKSTHVVKKRTDTFVIGAVLMFGLLVVVLVVMQLIFRRRDEKLVDLPDFCCTEEARLLLGDLNASVDPCYSFHDYVCVKSPHVGDSSQESPGLRSLEIEWALVEKLPDVANTSIGITLWLLGRSCARQDWRPLQALPEFTRAVVAAANLSRPETPLQDLTSIVQFMALMEFRFDAPVALSLTDGNRSAASDVSELTARWRGVSVQERMALCSACVIAVVRTLNNGSDVNETLSRLENLELPPPEYPDDENPAELNRVSIADVPPFKGVNPAGWNAVLNDLIWPIFPRVRVLKRRKQNDTDEALGRLASDVTVGGAFVIQHTVIELYAQLLSYTIYDLVKDRRECFANMLKVPAIEEAFRAQVVSSAAIDKYLQNVFARVRKTVSTQVSSSPSFISQQDASSVVNFLNDVSLVLPDVAGEIDQPPPRMTFSFSWNLLHARSFDFEIARRRTARKLRETQSAASLPHVTRRGSKVFVYAGAYADLYFWKRESHVMDLPVVAALLAKELWAMLFERMDARSNETAQNATTVFRECFRRAYCHDAVSDECDGLAEWAAALGTIVEAADAIKWRREGLLEANVPISEGRLFYLEWASAMCNVTLPQGVIPSDGVNVPLRHTADFAARFKCPEGSPMTQRAYCPT
ncbi:hypothetical protein HPB52_017220 [Rhipicephalus sanguineus]|uniref:Uncharacterized protein n=1 Tax=Rhipicephalus sanguineus TaxID=34632 RepID=A0A9D4PNK2_RHISA|nr:hypothetical protein HPB52_017220 [Rhipicephalus sanguineus]